jgi:hypothetical protein
MPLLKPTTMQVDGLTDPPIAGAPSSTGPVYNASYLTIFEEDISQVEITMGEEDGM